MADPQNLPSRAAAALVGRWLTLKRIMEECAKMQMETGHAPGAIIVRSAKDLEMFPNDVQPLEVNGLAVVLDPRVPEGEAHLEPETTSFACLRMTSWIIRK